MKSIKTLLIIIIILFANTFIKSCKDDSPSIQKIRIVNDSNFVLEKVVIQSKDYYLRFQNILNDSISDYKSGEDISTSLIFYITVNKIEIQTDWELPRQLDNYSKGKIFIAGEYEFSITHIGIDETNNDNTATISLSYYSSY